MAWNMKIIRTKKSAKPHTRCVAIRSNRSIQVIGISLGVVCTVAATALGAYGIWFWIDHSNFPGPLFGGVVLLVVLGIQGFVLALVGEYLGRIQRDVEGRPLYTIDKELG